MKMKKLNTILLGSLFVSLLAINSCDPFDELYLTLAMDIQLNTEGAGSDISIVDTLCLSEFEDYDDNKDKIEEIRYVSSAYLTLDATIGLQAQTLKLYLYQEDGITELFNYTIQNFYADSTKIKPLAIVLTQQEKNNISTYLANPQKDKCFVGKLTATNVQPNNTLYFLKSKLDFLTELKIKPQ